MEGLVKAVRDDAVTTCERGAFASQLTPTSMTMSRPGAISLTVGREALPSGEQRPHTRNPTLPDGEMEVA